MTIDKTRRRFNIPAEWPRSLIESEGAYRHRLIATGVRYGVCTPCVTSLHDSCMADACRCYCHAPTKRFTDAELAAEHWHSVAREAEAELRSRLADTVSGADHYQRVNLESGPQTETLHRFATLPHHDQEPTK